MSKKNHSHSKSKDIHWAFEKKDHELGSPFCSVWCRKFIDAEPSVWEIKLTSKQVVPAHMFQSQTVQIFIEGSVRIDGEGDCGEGDVRWAEGGVQSGSWTASPLGARFYLIGMEGAPTASEASSSEGQGSGSWQRNNPNDLEWGELGDGEHVAPPGKICALCPNGPSVMLLCFDPNCVASAHSHPGNIIYIVTEGQMTIPGEGAYEKGDMRWALKDYDYNQEIMGPTGTTLIGIQKGAFSADWTE